MVAAMIVPTPNEEFTPSGMLRNNPGMIRDCFWDKDWFVIRQISADSDNGQDGLKIKTFRLSKEEARILVEAINDHTD